MVLYHVLTGPLWNREKDLDKISTVGWANQSAGPSLGVGSLRLESWISRKTNRQNRIGIRIHFSMGLVPEKTRGSTSGALRHEPSLASAEEFVSNWIYEKSSYWDRGCLRQFGIVYEREHGSVAATIPDQMGTLLDPLHPFSSLLFWAPART